MRLIKPAWISHDGKPIFSIDIHPDGSRVATGGQGENSGKVAIWNMGPIRDEKLEFDENVPKLLCQMDNHLACVNCVRWSYDGRCLASAGDDKLVMIWQTSRNAAGSSVFGGGGRSVNLESWRVSNTLRGHSGDVLDLAWSVNNAWLATCSVDNTIIVWNANKFPEQITVLKGHTGMVKGVTWDPIGKYLASQSDDKTVRIWRTFDWKLETTITEPFQQCGGTTHVLRLDWSPDGQYIVTAHAMNNSGPTAQIIERAGWRCGLDYVGHRKAITVVRYNSRIMAKKSKKSDEKEKRVMSCAVGSRDRTLSIWMSHMQRPLMVMHDLFTDSILDISWSNMGSELMCCSWDGSVAYFGLSKEEVGRPVSDDEKMSELKKLYGKNVLSSGLDISSQIIESPLILTMQQKQQQQKQEQKQQSQSCQQPQKQSEMEKSVSNQTSNNAESPKKSEPYKPAPPPPCHNSTSMSASMPPHDRQIETRTKDGKRRITPIFLAPQPEFGDVPLPYTVGGACSQGPVFTSTKETSSILVEKLSEVSSPVTVSAALRFRENSRSQFDASELPAKISRSDSMMAEQNKTTAQFCTPDQATATSNAQPASSTSTVPTKPPTSLTGEIRISAPHSPDVRAPRSAPSDFIYKKKDGRGRPRKDKVGELPRQQQQQLTEQTTGANRNQQTSSSNNQKQMQDQLTSALPVTATTRASLLPAASLNGCVSIQISSGFSASVSGATVLTLEIENSVESVSAQSGMMLPLHRLRCLSDGRPLWQTFLSTKALAATGNSMMACVACNDLTLNVYSTSSGQRLCSPLVLTGAVSQLRCTGAYVITITTQGVVSVWNIKLQSCIIRQESITHLFSGRDTVRLESCSITSQGLPVLTFSNGRSYTFKPELASWVLVTASDDLVARCSNHQSCLKGLPSDKRSATGSLSTLQSIKSKSSTQALHLSRLSDPVLQTLTTSHIENQLSACLALQSRDEYHFWFITYSRYLVQEGLEVKLRELCNSLLGPPATNGFSASGLLRPSWESTVLGLKKHDVLAEILPIIATNIQLQRVFNEYREQLTAATTSSTSAVLSAAGIANKATTLT